MTAVKTISRCKREMNEILEGKTFDEQAALLERALAAMRVRFYGKEKWRPFKEAREFVRSLGLETTWEWEAWAKNGRPMDIPATPQKVYVDEWKGMTDWLGKKKSKWRPFNEAREFVRSLGLVGVTEWQNFSKSGNRPKDIPSSPWNIYPDWEGMPDWMGSGRKPHVFRWRPFKEAREYSRSLGFKTFQEWNAWGKKGLRPKDIPASPHNVYAADWKSREDWLGCGIRSTLNNWRPYEEAKAFVSLLEIKSVDHWRGYCDSGFRPDDIPSSPQRVYSGAGWVDWFDWLGKKRYRVGRIENNWRPFKEARKYTRSLGLKLCREWAEYCKAGKIPEDIPASPYNVYATDGWIGMKDWLGIEET